MKTCETCGYPEHPKFGMVHDCAAVLMVKRDLENPRPVNAFLLSVDDRDPMTKWVEENTVRTWPFGKPAKNPDDA